MRSDDDSLSQRLQTDEQSPDLKDEQSPAEPNGERQSNSSININSIEASPIQRISPNASSMSFQSGAGSNRKTRISSNLLSTQQSQLNTSSSASRFKPPNLFKD